MFFKKFHSSYAYISYINQDSAEIILEIVKGKALTTFICIRSKIVYLLVKEKGEVDIGKPIYRSLEKSFLKWL